MKRWGTLTFLCLFLSFVSTCSNTSPVDSTGSDSGNDGGNNNPFENVVVKFISFGDWGTGDANQAAVATQAQSTCQNQACDFGLLLGDNFYNTGVSSTADAQWQSKYRDVYASLELSFYALLGNHDWDSPANPQAQIDYSNLDTSWIMPAAYYTQSFPSSEVPLLQIFVINSNDFRTNSDEQSWLSTQINASEAQWKIVAFHHPVFSNGSAHPPDQKQIYETLQPIICNKVDLLISGHDHFFSHLRDNTESCGYDQLVIGTGGKSLYDISPADSAPATILYTEKSFGLGYFIVQENQISFQFMKTDNTSSYSYSWQK